MGSRFDISGSLVTVTKISNEVFELEVPQGLDKNLAEKLVASVKDKKDKIEITLKSEIYLKHQPENLAPAQRGEVFIIPQLCLKIGDTIELAETESCLEPHGWNLLDYPAVLTQDEFEVNGDTKQYIVDIDGQKITIKFLNKVEQLSFKCNETEGSDVNLCYWLDKKLKAPDIKQEILWEFLRRIIENLLARDDLDLAKLLYGKYILEKVLKAKIANYRNLAHSQAYQSSMFGEEAALW